MPDSVSTILVVDDDPVNRALARTTLEPEHRTLEAEDGREALTLLERHAVDLVLLDAMMPGPSGFETCRAIKDRPGPYLPVLLLTALREQEDKNRGLEAGADDFLRKPIDPRELQLRVRAFLRLRAQDAVIRKQVEDLRHLQALKDDLLSLIVHDLRNPLMGVMGYLDVLAAELPEAASVAVREDVRGAIAAAQELHEEINEILDVRKLEEGELRPLLEPGSLRTIAQAAIGTFAGVARDKRVELVLVPGEEVSVPLDPRLVRRAVENLIANGLRYAPRGSRIELAAGPAPEGAFLEVADQGQPIPDAQKDALFGKFGPLGSRPRNERSGYGLGLYLVQLVATAHRGTVAVADRAGGGVVLRLFFPRATA